MKSTPFHQVYSMNKETIFRFQRDVNGAEALGQFLDYPEFEKKLTNAFGKRSNLFLPSRLPKSCRLRKSL
jgi:hypothetical protein